MITEHICRVLIIGSGPAGYTAAIYAARANLKPVLIEGLQPGGQLTITTDVENYPGFADVVQGPWLMEQMKAQAAHVGTEIVADYINKVDFVQNEFVAYSDFGKVYRAESLIIATGAEAKWLGLPSEKKFMGAGVSGCATCDGFFYRNKTVAVVGGGNSAVEEALYLTNHANKVYIIHRRDQFRAEKISQERLFNHPKIEVIWNSIVEEIVGTEAPLSVNGLNIKNVVNNQNKILPVDGVFVAIGHKPNTGLFADKLDLDSEGYIITKPNSTVTSVKGVFACGDVQDKVYRQAVTAAGTGCMAAIEVEKFLAHKSK